MFSHIAFVSTYPVLPTGFFFLFFYFKIYLNSTNYKVEYRVRRTGKGRITVSLNDAVVVARHCLVTDIVIYFPSA